jgi:hypothetical protein
MFPLQVTCTQCWLPYWFIMSQTALHLVVWFSDEGCLGRRTKNFKNTSKHLRPKLIHKHWLFYMYLNYDILRMWRFKSGNHFIISSFPFVVTSFPLKTNAENKKFSYCWRHQAAAINCIITRIFDIPECRNLTNKSSSRLLLLLLLLLLLCAL